MENQHEPPATLWIAVRGTRGFAAQVQSFTSPDQAEQHVDHWRATQNPAYDDADIFEIFTPV